MWLFDFSSYMSHVVFGCLGLGGVMFIGLLLYSTWVWVDDGEYLDQDVWGGLVFYVPIFVFSTLFVLGAMAFFYLTSIIIIGTILFLRLVRFTRRLFKRFNLHEKDPEAHLDTASTKE